MKPCCVVCNAETTLRCGGCKYTSYCSKECRVRDLTQHAPRCIAPSLRTYVSLCEQQLNSWPKMRDAERAAEEVIARLDAQEPERQYGYHHKLRENIMAGLREIRSSKAAMMLVAEEAKEAERRQEKQMRKAAKKKHKKETKRRQAAEDVAGQMAHLDLDTECVVCMDAVRQVRNMPCGHEVMCQECAAGVLAAAKHTAACPYCGQSFFYTMLIK